MYNLIKIFLLATFILNNLTAETILVVRESNPAFLQVLQGFNDEIGEDYSVVDFTINSKSTYSDFTKKIKATKPDLLLVMDETAVQFAKKLNSVKTIAVMGLNFQKTLINFKNICGISYETAPYSIVSEFQDISSKKVNKISILYRKQYNQKFIEDAKRQLSRSKVIVNAIDLDSVANNKKKLRKKLAKILKKQTKRSSKNDAIVVLGDNVLLERSLFSKVWIPAANKAKIPFLSGIKVLSSKKLNFCAFTASPDHIAMGSQAAQFAYNILEEGVSPQEIGIQYAAEIETNINKKKFRKLRIK
ncbi:MAG: hypothetical protein KC646_16885 [Candidatus Cloacimonetes bacterium]|nr:hypothetical protein [Candidatus Cloacimonadota bacterium]